MLQFGALAFATPWMLLGLAALPAIWWLLRISPPLPKRVRFPAIRLLLGLAQEEETPAHTPLWLLLLRLILAALIVGALADPLWNPAPKVAGSGPLLIVVDNGWTAAAHWPDRANAMEALLAEARRDDRPVLVVGSAPTAVFPALAFAAPDDAAARARALRPMPVANDRPALARRLESSSAIPKTGVQTVWLSDGIDGGDAVIFSRRLLKIAGTAGLDVVEPRREDLALALLPPATEGAAFVATVLRADAEVDRAGSVRALNADGSLVGEINFSFSDGQIEAPVAFDLPLELRNRIDRIEIAGEMSAGAVSLIDERWRRRAVGLVSGASFEEAQPLLSDLYYLQRALEQHAEIRRAASDRGSTSEIADLLAAPLSVIALADVGRLIGADRDAVAGWVERGGILLRFAGPRLAGEGDDLIPVPLRTGGRALGGALSWTNPQRLAPFDAASPFFGLSIPGDVTVSRQVLAEPTLDLADRTWARLQDGTPLVTAARRGKGLIVLFHVSANSAWSNLPLSGLFVDMLRRIVAQSQGVAASGEDRNANEATLPPARTLDGFGHLGSPPATAAPLAAAAFGRTPVGPRHPPGLYGPSDSPRAFNLARPGLSLEPIGALSGVATRHPYTGTAETPLRPWALALALALILADGVAALYVTGLFDASPIRRRRRGVAILPAAVIGIAMLANADPAGAADDAEAFTLRAVTETHLAYVLTGDGTVDEQSRAGLTGLSDVLRMRTSFEPAEPMGVDVARDELSFYPLLYWPMTAGQEDLSPETLSRVDRYMKNGGTILFDTRDRDRAIDGRPGAGAETLRRLLGRLDLPALEPVPDGHVLSKSFYLMRDFPGRWAGGQLWVEAAKGAGADGRPNDGVSAIIVGSNDYAGAWARDESGRPLFPAQPGGEMQRELAERFGVNLVMYALTGNYKSDQVHVPALLERLGR